MSEPDHFDAVVVGAGLVGAAAALGLAGQGRRVALIERAEPARNRGRLGIDLRTVALSPASQALLAGLGVRLADHGCAFTGMRVWQELGTASLAFDAANVDSAEPLAELGRMVEVSEVASRLWREVLDEPRIDIRLGEAVSHLEFSAERVRVTCGEQHIDAELVLGCDGGASSTRRLAGVDATPRPTGQSALVTVARFEQPHGNLAYQRFLGDGPLALLPAAKDNLISIVWSASSERAQQRQALSDAGFIDELTAASGQRLGRVLEVDQRVVFPLYQHVADSFAPRSRLLLLGDAARVLHPLAGLGVNLGLEDVDALLAVTSRLPASVSLGAPVYRPFGRKRRLRAEMMVAAMSAFRRGFGTSDPLAVLLRNTGARLIDAQPWLKNQFVAIATGVQ